MHRADSPVTVRDDCPEPEIITQDEIRDLIRAEAEQAGSINRLCQKLRMPSSTPVYLAIRKDRDVSDLVALYFGYKRVIMYERIGRVARR